MLIITYILSGIRRY